jgi:hypothetical protein
VFINIIKQGEVSPGCYKKNTVSARRNEIHTPRITGLINFISLDIIFEVLIINLKVIYFLGNVDHSATENK